MPVSRVGHALDEPQRVGEADEGSRIVDVVQRAKEDSADTLHNASYVVQQLGADALTVGAENRRRKEGRQRLATEHETIL